MKFTVEKMISAVKYEPTKKSRYKLYDSFRMMYFHGFMDADIWEKFNEAWGEMQLRGLI